MISHLPRCPSVTVVFSISLCALISAGCGDSDPFEYQQVGGKLTYEDDAPVPGETIALTFVPQTAPLDAKTHPRRGNVFVNAADGTFENVTSYKFADGLVRGKHKVLVVERGPGDQPIYNHVPQAYQSVETTPLEVDTADAPFRLKIKRP